MSKKKDSRPRDSKPAAVTDHVLTEAETAEVLASAPAGIAPRTADNPAGLLTYREIAPGVSVGPGVDIVPAAVLPVGKRGDKGFVWELDQLWTERVERMATVAGLSSQSYLDSLLRRAWVGMDQRHRGRL